jgi:hypothetical protein
MNTPPKTCWDCAFIHAEVLIEGYAWDTAECRLRLLMEQDSCHAYRHHTELSEAQKDEHVKIYWNNQCDDYWHEHVVNYWDQCDPDSFDAD